MDKDAFDNKVLMLSEQLYRMAKSILLDEELAKDCVQDLYLKLWEKRTTLNEIENMPAFAMKVLRNICLDKLRKKIEITIEIQEYTSVHDHKPLHETIEQKDMMRLIKQYINRLPELQKTIVRLRDVEGFEIKEIAEITSSTENAVMANLSRARQKIRNYLMKNE
jgi:RNA polymerase sigma-70 factor (ECF subfamily)